MTKICTGLLAAMIAVVLASCDQPPLRSRQPLTADQQMAERLKRYMVYFKDDRGICYSYTAPYGMDSSVMTMVPCDKAGL